MTMPPEHEPTIQVALTKAEWAHLEPIVRWLRVQLDVELPPCDQSSPERFTMTRELADAFGYQLRIFHAMHGDHEALSKKAFEYALDSAATSAGFRSSISDSATTPGADIMINGQGFSIKTEAGRSISKQVVFLTKLMESAWTKNLSSIPPFVEGIRANVLPRLLQPDRTLVWRCHSRLTGPERRAEYELLEIPKHYWEAMATVREEDFTPLTAAGSTSAPIRIGGKPIYTVSFDGSDQKVQIRNLQVASCSFLGRWIIHQPS